MNEAPTQPLHQTTMKFERELWERFCELAARNRRTRTAQMAVLMERALVEDEAERS